MSDLRLIAFAEAVERLLTPSVVVGDAHVKAVAADGRAGDHLVAELVLGDEVEALRRRLEDRRPARLVRGVHVLADQHRRGAERAAQVLRPDLLAAVALPA